MKYMITIFLILGAAALAVLILCLTDLEKRINRVAPIDEPKRFRDEPMDYVKWAESTWWCKESGTEKMFYVEFGFHNNGQVSWRWTTNAPKGGQ